MMHDLVNKYDITQNDLDFFEQNGFWASPVLISAKNLSLIKQHYFEVLNGNFNTNISPAKFHRLKDGSKEITKITNTIWSDTILSRLVLSYQIGKIAANLINADTIRFWRDHLWYKPPFSGQQGIVGWHQDQYYWQCAEPADLITAWVAFEDTTKENGCLEYLPGSHKWGLLNAGDLYSKDLKKLENSIKNVTGKEFSPIKCEIPAGAISFHHCLTVHGSNANTSAEPRMGMSIHLFPEGTIYRKGKSIKPFSNEVLLGGEDGDLFLGVHFPVLYRRNHMSNPYETLLNTNETTT